MRVEWWLRWSLAGEGRGAGIGAGLKKGGGVAGVLHDKGRAVKSRGE